MNRAELEATMTALAQGVINITEGLTTIEADSRIARAMGALVATPEEAIQGFAKQLRHEIESLERKTIGTKRALAWVESKT